MCHKQTCESPHQPIKEVQYRHVIISDVNKPKALYSIILQYGENFSLYNCVFYVLIVM